MNEVFLTVVFLIAVIIAITIHEFSHAYSAVRAGDDTPRLQGRISLNPIDHFDIVGFTMIVITSIMHFGIGWGKPVQIDPRNFRNYRWDNLKVSFWGPLSNILTGILLGLILRFFGASMAPIAVLFVYVVALVSFGLAFFNLIPIGPLDGAGVMESLLPPKLAYSFSAFNRRYSMLLLLGLILIAPRVLPIVIGVPRSWLISVVVGHPLNL